MPTCGHPVNETQGVLSPAETAPRNSSARRPQRNRSAGSYNRVDHDFQPLEMRVRYRDYGFNMSTQMARSEKMEDQLWYASQSSSQHIDPVLDEP